MVRWKALIFDLDGVLVSTDEQHYQAWKSLADRLGIPFDRTTNDRFRGVSRAACVDLLESLSGRSFSTDEKRAYAARKNEHYRELLKELSPRSLSPSVRPVLEALRAQGLLLAVASSSKNTRFILSRLGLSDFFDAVRDGTDIVRSKPDPEVFLKAAAALGVPPCACLVVEDALSGVQAAHAAGMTSCAIGGAVGCPPADLHVHSFLELQNIVKGKIVNQ